MTKKQVARELRRRLNALDEMLASKDEVSEMLWHVITALRGPDGYPDIKHQTTVHIRRLALPRTARNRSLEDKAVFETQENYSAPDIRTHFGRHVVQAIQALQKIDRRP